MQSRFAGTRLPTPVGVVGSLRSGEKWAASMAAYRTPEMQMGLRGSERIKPREATTTGKMAPFEDVIRAAARREGVDENLVKAVVEAESSFNPKAVSPAGAKGLMQLMDGTAKALGIEDPFDPVANVKGGVEFLRSMLDKFGSISLALAAYNAGPGAVEHYGGVPPYSETKAYVDKVIRLHRRNTSEGLHSRERGNHGGNPIG